jgi:RHS repeat-associated protein
MAVYPYMGEITETYEYSDSSWGDLLTNYNDTSISYDTIGNPTNWIGITTLYWDGRELDSITIDPGHTINYTYNSDGLRTRKVVGNKVYDYYWFGSQLAMMTITEGSNVITMKFYYDDSGRPMILDYNDTKYFYVTNLQGDVVGIVCEAKEVGSYVYDAWGNPISTSSNGTAEANIIQNNPLRYRGYIYDTETGFYYLQSRYYDPAIGRFINPDGTEYLGANGDLVSFNLYAYCSNNPVNGLDPCGTCIHRRDFWNDCDKCGGETIGEKWDSLKTFCKNAYNYVTNSDVETSKSNLEKDGFTFYKGVPVFIADWLDTAGFSYGFIVLGSGNLKRNNDYFSNTLNHEYGHTVQMRSIGLADYTFLVAIPSLIGAGIANANGTVKKYYFNLPWERSADYYGNVNRGYLKYADPLASYYWHQVELISRATSF